MTYSCCNGKCNQFFQSTFTRSLVVQTPGTCTFQQYTYTREVLKLITGSPFQALAWLCTVEVVEYTMKLLIVEKYNGKLQALRCYWMWFCSSPVIEKPGYSVNRSTVSPCQHKQKGVDFSTKALIWYFHSLEDTHEQCNSRFLYRLTPDPPPHGYVVTQSLNHFCKLVNLEQHFGLNNPLDEEPPFGETTRPHEIYIWAISECSSVVNTLWSWSS